MKKVISVCLALCLALTVFGGITVNAKGYLTIAEYSEEGSFINFALDQLMVNNEAEDLCAPGNAGDYLTKNKNVIEGKYDNIVFKGWVGFDQEIKRFGYCIGDGDPVLIDGTVINPEDAVKGAGGEYAVRYRYPIDVTSVTSKTEIVPVAELEDGTIVSVIKYNVFYDPTATGEKEVEYEVAITGGSQSTAMAFHDKTSVGFKINVPAGKKLGDFVIINSPTWGAQENAGLVASIYDWKGTYEDSIDNDPFGSVTIEEHIDCQSLLINFDYVPEGDYLIEFTDFTDQIGGWTASEGILPELEDQFVFFMNEIEADAVPMMRITYKDNTNPPEPTAVPTAKPTAAPTEVPTEAPATDVPATDAPEDKTTDAPSAATQKPAEKADDAAKKSNTPLVICIVAAAVVIAAVVAVIIIKKNKK